MKRLIPYLYATLLIAVTAIAAGAWYVHDVLHDPLPVPDEGVTVEIRPGSALATVSGQLAAQGIMPAPRVFRWYGRLRGEAGAIHAGEYRIESGTTPISLLRKFVSGDVRLYSLTIVEGWQFRELLQAMAAHPAIRPTPGVEDWPSLRDELGSDRDHPEGLFLPETYRFPKHTTDRELLRQAHVLMKETLATAWETRVTDLPLSSPYEALVLASIVEKETARADERSRIAGVFVRRLQKGMRLGADPTVIYGIGERFDGNLTRSHLRTDTDYNTYTRRGLPPTPIALPGRAAINAALHPADGSAVYFVATGLGDGSHRFSDTKEEHDAAVRVFLQRQRAARSGEQ
jgi:UPF0755 protein